MIQVASALRLVGTVAGAWGLATVLLATLAYLPGHPGFSVFATYLSDIGATDAWPRIIFNAGTLIAAPLRYLAIALLALRMSQLGAGRAFVVLTLLIAFVSTAGTVVMTAVPYDVSAPVHKAGIPLYFLGVVVLQTLIGVRQWSLQGVPRILPLLCFLLVIVYLVFAVLVNLHERGMASRETPVIWEWLAFSVSIVWVLSQSILLGRDRLVP